MALLLSLLYVLPSWLYAQSAYDATHLVFIISLITASTASLLFATSLSLGSISYFTGWPNMRLGYQKQIGVLAFWYSFVHCITLVVLYPELYGTGLPQHFFSADVLLGLISMTIFAAMVLITTPLLSSRVTKETIGFVLGLGYVGYALLVIRAILIEFPLWLNWYETWSGLPPGRLILSVIALVVLTMRVAVAVDKQRKISGKQ